MSRGSTVEDPIDAVILWVDGKDKKQMAKMLPYLEDGEKSRSRKFKSRYEQVDEVRFTIDSILKFAPYIRNIYLVTDDQTPRFLTEENAKSRYKNVSVIDHRVIFSGYEEYLPVFNSRAIETCIYRIPGLSEHFIYLNDDFFLINGTKPGDFFRDGQPVLRGKWTKFDRDRRFKKKKKTKAGHKTAQQKGAQLIGHNTYYRFRHTPHPLRKSTFEAFFEANKAVFLENINHKFRHRNQFIPQGLANHLEIKNKTCVLKSDLQLKYFRSYKKPLLWYKWKLNFHNRGKLFLGLQSLNNSPPAVLDYILEWLEKRVS